MLPAAKLVLLMKEGKRDEADGRRAEVNALKERIAELDQLRYVAEARMRDSSKKSHRAQTALIFRPAAPRFAFVEREAQNPSLSTR